jgi:uncharacterized protein YjiS (DUF1127 family)
MSIHVLGLGPVGTAASDGPVIRHPFPGAALLAEIWETLRDSVAAPALQSHADDGLDGLSNDVLADLGLTRRG